MAKHANKSKRSMLAASSAGKNRKPSKQIGEASISRDKMELEIKLLTWSGVDDGLAKKWCAAIAMDDLGASVMRAELLRHSGVFPLALRWDCKVINRAMPARAQVVDAYKLAHLCASKRVFAWLIGWGIEEESEGAYDALSRLSQSFGDGRGNSAEVRFARDALEALFAPDTAQQARDMLDGLRLDPGLGPHVERFVREACLGFLAKEERSLLRVAADRPQPLRDGGALRPRL